MNNNKGFTLVELLGSMVILGLLMVMVVPNIVGILSKNKEKTYKEDAKKLVEVAKYKMSMRKDFNPPSKNNECIILGLGYLDNSEFANPPNGGCYDVTRSFVVIKIEDHRYTYYVQLVEYFEGKYTGIIGPIKFEDLNNPDSYVENDNINYSYFAYTEDNKALILSDEIKPEVNGEGSKLKEMCSHGIKALAHNGPKTYSIDSRGICAQKSV